MREKEQQGETTEAMEPVEKPDQVAAAEDSQEQPGVDDSQAFPTVEIKQSPVQLVKKDSVRGFEDIDKPT